MMMVNTVVVVAAAAAAVLQKMCYGSMMELSWEGEEGILSHYSWVIKFLVKSLAIRPCDAAAVVAGPLSLQGRQRYWHCHVVLPLLGLGPRFRRHVGPRMMRLTQQTPMMIPTYSACEVSRVAAVVVAAAADPVAVDRHDSAHCTASLVVTVDDVSSFVQYVKARHAMMMMSRHHW
jgi:hypothetical protein